MEFGRVDVLVDNAGLSPLYPNLAAKSRDLDSFAEGARTTMALGRHSEPGEVVGAARFLAGAAPSCCTDPVLHLDRGVR